LRYAKLESALSISLGRIKSFLKAAKGSPGRAIPIKPSESTPANLNHLHPRQTAIMALKIAKGKGTLWFVGSAISHFETIVQQSPM
jgi:hypothetical protein